MKSHVTHHVDGAEHYGQRLFHLLMCSQALTAKERATSITRIAHLQLIVTYVFAIVDYY